MPRRMHFFATFDSRIFFPVFFHKKMTLKKEERTVVVSVPVFESRSACASVHEGSR